MVNCHCWMQRWPLQQQDLLVKSEQPRPSGRLARNFTAMWSWSFEHHAAEVSAEPFPDLLESYLYQLQGTLPDLRDEKLPFFNFDLWRMKSLEEKWLTIP